MDFDRTLFDTSSFFNEVWQLLADLYGIDADAERQRIGEFQDNYVSGYDYRFFDHARSAVGERFNKADFTKAAQREFKDMFLYADVSDEVIALIDAIVTFGGHEYQLFKLSLCPRLVDIKVYTTLQPKGECIAQTFNEPALLVDDKPLENEIIPPTRFIRIDRAASEQATQSSVIRSLAELHPLIG